jgi:hypothetical protein
LGIKEFSLQLQRISNIMKSNRVDLDCIWDRLSLPNNNPLAVPFGTILSSTGICDFQASGTTAAARPGALPTRCSPA